MNNANTEQLPNAVAPAPDPMKSFVPAFNYPTHTNEECVAAIVAGNAEREQNEVFIDRRDPRQLRSHLENIQNAEAILRRDLGTVSSRITVATKELAQLRKLEKQYAKHAGNRFAADSHKEVQAKVATAEKGLAALRFRETGIGSTLRNATQGVKEFLAASPRKGFPTNKEFIAQFAEAEDLERDLRHDQRRASW